MICRNSIGRQAAIRLFFSLGLLVILIAVSSVGIYQVALGKAAHKRADELISFYASRLDLLEREWEMRSRDFKVRIEITRALENPATAVTNLQAFMTIQGADRPFQYLLIQTEDGKKLFDYGKDLQLPTIPESAEIKFGYYHDTKNKHLYRVLEHPIWLGEERGMGRFAVFIRIDNALLNRLSTPGLTLNALHEGEVVASSGGQAVIDLLHRSQNVAEAGKEIRELPWSGRDGDPIRLQIEAPVTTLFTTTELSLSMSAIPLIDGLVLWLTIGVWLMRQTRRITSLGNAVGEYASARQVTGTMTTELACARQGQADEIAGVSEVMGAMVAAIDQRERERVAANERLHESETRLLEVTSALADGVLVVGLDGKISFVNPRAELFLGWPAEELLGRDCHETLHYHVPANECKVNGEIRIGEEYHSEEYSFMRRDGRILPVALTATPVRRDGAVVGAVVTFQDITARLAAEKAVRESEVRFRTLFNSSGDVVLVHPLIGKDGGFGKFVEVNDIACQRLGYTRAEMLSMTPLDLDIPGSFPSPAEIEAVQKGILDEGRLMFERVHVTKDGRQIPVEINAHTFELNGEMMTLSIVRDITERKQAENLLLANEERIHLATSAGNVGIWDWDVANNKLVWDENMYTLYGMSEKDFDGAYEAWSRTLHPDDRQCVEVEMQAALHGEREYAPEFRIVRPDGCIRNIQASAKSFFDPQGNPLRMIGTNLDITERKQTEAALREAKIEAEQANHAKSEFLAHMSHEIRTPLNAIVGAARLMDGENLTPQQTSYARIMRHSSRSLLTLIQNILDLSKIEAGCAELETGIFELAPIIDGLAGVATASAQGKDIAFNFDLAPDLPPRLMGDPYRLEQVLNNLLSNAIKFTTQGEVSLRVQKVSEDEKSARLLFTLADTGIGISREKLGVIFEPFAQAENTTTRTHGGTGLGLAISRRLVEMMGGAIEIESTPGKGSRFTFTVTFQLPTAAEIAPTQASQRIECADFSPATTPLAGRRVLMVEDNEFNRVVLEGILQRFGIQVDAAIDGYDGVERFQAGCPYDAILMDLHLPGQDGFDCTRAIRALPEGAQVPIIAFTANVLSTTGSKCRAAGMNDHLSKPVEPDILLRTLIYWILGEGSSAPVKAAPAAEDQTDRLPDALPGIDRAKALAFSIGARAFAKLLDHMLSHCGNDPAKLAQHIRGGDIEAAAGITHDLMSVSSMVGASALFDAARQLNHELRAGNPASALAQEASDSMATEFARLNEAREILRPWLD